MTRPLKVIAPRAPTPTPSATTVSKTTTRLPDGFLEEGVQRLGLFSAVAAGLWTFGLLLDLVFLRAVPGAFAPSAMVQTIELLAIAAAAGMYVYVRYAPHSARTKAEVGLGFMLVNTFGIGVINAWQMLPDPVFKLSWNAVAILIFSMIVPTTPRKMLVVAMASASMDPFGVWVRSLTGAQVPALLTVLVLYLPNYACAAVAATMAATFERLGRRLREAQDLGSYRLVELLGHGGMGEVWRAEHHLLARRAAVKIVKPEVLGTGSAEDTRLVLRRFEREAQATSSLSSPHTIQVYDYGITDQGTFYYVMELLSGRDMDSLVREFGPVPADRTIYLLRQAAHSLADAHARGLVHRDIKPANIYVCRMGLEYDFVKVLDFGLVKVRQPGTQVQETLQTVDHTTGTPAFMAPEIILGEADVDRRADVYALGCVAYYLLTGQLVFEVDTPMKTLLRHVQEKPVPPSMRTELQVPKELDDLVMACLEKDPDDRPHDAQALFRMACGCRTCETWDAERARSWWETHLPDLTGPLTLGASDPAPLEVPVG